MKLLLIILLLLLIHIVNTYIINTFEDIKIFIASVITTSIIFGLIFEKIVSYKRKIYTKKYDELLVKLVSLKENVILDNESLQESVKNVEIEFKEYEEKYKKMKDKVIKLDNEEATNYLNKIEPNLEKYQYKFNLKIESIKKQNQNIKEKLKKLNLNIDKLKKLKLKIVYARTYKGILKDLILFRSE